jgi:hypothetical protein
MAGMEHLGQHTWFRHKIQRLQIKFRDQVHECRYQDLKRGNTEPAGCSMFSETQWQTCSPWIDVRLNFEFNTDRVLRTFVGMPNKKVITYGLTIHNSPSTAEPLDADAKMREILTTYIAARDFCIMCITEKKVISTCAEKHYMCSECHEIFMASQLNIMCPQRCNTYNPEKYPERIVLQILSARTISTRHTWTRNK